VCLSFRYVSLSLSLFEFSTPHTITQQRKRRSMAPFVGVVVAPKKAREEEEEEEREEKRE
jgi:hypothetical protein